MEAGLIILLIVIAIIAIVVIGVIVMYNRFVQQRNLVTESWRQIDVELKRRYDLIPNLIETVKAFAAHERQVFDSVVQARANAVQVHDAPGRGAEAQARAESQLSGTLGRLFAVAENYPDLKSNQNFVQLQREMVDTEDRIAAGRRFYNGNVRALNTRVESFPSNIIAGIFKFSKEQYFELDEVGARDSIRADFSSLTGTDPAGRTEYREPGSPGFIPESISAGDQSPMPPASHPGSTAPGQAQPDGQYGQQPGQFGQPQPGGQFGQPGDPGVPPRG